MQPIDALWGAATALGGVVVKQFNDRFASQEARLVEAEKNLTKRLDAIEIATKDRALDDRALRDAVIKLTVTVELLAKQVEALAARSEG